MRALAAASLVAAAAASPACRATSDFYLHAPPVSMLVFPGDTSIAEGDTFTLRPSVLDAQGDTLRDEPPIFTSTDTAVLRVSTAGVVRGVGVGSAAIGVAAGNATSVVGVNVRDSSLIATVFISFSPYAIGIGPKATYVTGLSTVTRLDLSSLTTMQLLEFYSTPRGMAFDAAGDLAYAANEDESYISIISVATDMKVDSIATSGGSVTVAVSGDALFTGTTTDYLYRFDLGTKRATDSIALRGTAWHLLPDPADTTLFLSTWDPNNSATGDVVEVNARTTKVIRTVHVGWRPEAMALSPDRQTLYVTNDAEPYILEIALSAGAVTDSIALAGPAFGLAIAPDGGRLYAGLVDGGMEAVGRTTGVMTRLAYVGGAAREVAYDAVHQRVLVAMNQAEFVAVFKP